MIRVPVTPEMLRWVCERPGYDVAHVARRVPQLRAWVQGESDPTLKQLEKLRACGQRTPSFVRMNPHSPERLVQALQKANRRGTDPRPRQVVPLRHSVAKIRLF